MTAVANGSRTRAGDSGRTPQIPALHDKIEMGALLVEGEWREQAVCTVLSKRIHTKSP